MHTQIYQFNSKELPLFSQVGGKAKSLINTTQAGFSVPKGIVLTVEFFRPWADFIKSSDIWQKALKNLSKDHCDQLKELASTLTLGEVQKQIASEISGTGYSLNPLNNCYDEVIIDASYGLGEAIVSGLVTPDSYIIDKISHEIIQKDISEKTKGLYLNHTGGTLWKTCSAPLKQALNDEQILEVTELISQCESHYGLPIDIEWAYENNQLYLLQARPITTYTPLYKELMTNPGMPKKLYVDLLVCTQGFSEPLSVLGMDYWEKVYDMIGKGLLPLGKDGLITIIGGKLYFNVSNTMKAFGPKLGTEIIGNQDYVIKDHREYIGQTYKTTQTSKKIKHAKWALIKKQFALIKQMNVISKNASKRRDDTLHTIQKIILKLKSLKNNNNYEGIVHEAFSYLDLIYDYVEDYSLGEMAKMQIKKLFKDKDMIEHIDAMGMNLSNNPTAMMAKGLYNIAVEPEMIDTTDERILKIK